MVRALKPYIIRAVEHHGGRIARVQIETEAGHVCQQPLSTWNIAQEIIEGRDVRTATGALVNVVRDGHTLYLRTDPDKTPANNLGELPEIGE